MSQPDTHHQSAYTYTPSSAASTRQLLESTATTTPQQSSSTSSSDNSINTSAPADPATDLAFRPQVFKRRSTNYTDADAAARSATASAAHSSGGGATATTAAPEARAARQDETDSASSGTGWKPRLNGRTQSWNRQDLIHAMQMSSTGGGQGAGFSEVPSARP
ncbi:MAG: hypothetical protein M1818_000480 [Claussenomyces sp. TS43310]|nr:MAG: hypothetical protein M1818_000480 [Claussenomyces sp. TS43310]